LVFGNLLRRWNTFAPVELQFPNLEWQGVVSAYNLKTRTLTLNSTAEIGTTGWVKYRFNDPQQVKVATILAHFAEFAGVGRKTGMGMGASPYPLIVHCTLHIVDCLLLKAMNYEL
jgi:CRISPR-associated endoribonuclease Cas6